jgi:excisionase family DNA binding protein
VDLNGSSFFIGGIIMLGNYPDLLTLDEVAEILRCCRKKAIKTVKANRIKYIQFGREYRILKNALIEFLTGPPEN